MLSEIWHCSNVDVVGRDGETNRGYPEPPAESCEPAIRKPETPEVHFDGLFSDEVST